MPQYDTPRCNTRIGHDSQIAARCVQSDVSFNIPNRRSRAAADFAAARDSDAKLLGRQHESDKAMNFIIGRLSGLT